MWLLLAVLVITTAVSQSSGQPTTGTENTVSGGSIPSITVIESHTDPSCPPCINKFSAAVLEQVTLVKIRLVTTGAFIRELIQLKYDVRAIVNQSQVVRNNVDYMSKLSANLNIRYLLN